MSGHVTSAIVHSVPKSSYLISEHFKTIFANETDLPMVLGPIKQNEIKTISFENMNANSEFFQISYTNTTNPFSATFTFAGVVSILTTFLHLLEKLQKRHG